MRWLLDLLANAWRLAVNLQTRLPGGPLDYVVVTLTGAYPERSTPARPFWQRLVPAPWVRQEESLETFRALLERVAASPRVRGMVLRVRGLTAGLATIQSLRDAILDLRRRGKRVVAYLPEANLPSYYLGTAADEVAMAPAGFWAVTGLRSETTFLRRAFDRIGLLPQFERIAEYKTAAEPFMRDGMSGPHREMVDSILDALTAEVVGDVAAARRLDPDAVRRAIDGAPLAAETAASAGLVDTVCYDDELPTRLGAPGRPAVLLSWEQARRRLPVSYRWSARTSVIGVIDLAGAIVTGESRESPVPLPLLGRRFAGSDTVARAFRAAERSPGIRAVVFHVDSGGGSALASDLIWREVEWVRRTKPVVVFMSNVAGQLTARGLFDRLGLAREIVARGRAATMDSAFEPLSEELLARVRGSMQAIYRRFVGAVATGRGKSRDEIETVARGRI